MCSYSHLWPIFFLLGPGIFRPALGGLSSSGSMGVLAQQMSAPRCVLEHLVVSDAQHGVGIMRPLSAGVACLQVLWVPRVSGGPGPGVLAAPPKATGEALLWAGVGLHPGPMEWMTTSEAPAVGHTCPGSCFYSHVESPPGDLALRGYCRQSRQASRWDHLWEWGHLRKADLGLGCVVGRAGTGREMSLCLTANIGLGLLASAHPCSWNVALTSPRIVPCN